MVPPSVGLLRRRAPAVVARLLLVLALAGWFRSPVAAFAGEAPAHRPGEVIIGWQPGAALIPLVPRAPGALLEDQSSPAWQSAVAALAQASGLDVLAARADFGYARLKTPVGEELAEAARLRELPWVKYAEPNYIARAAGDTGFYPNDPQIGLQWNMRRVDAPQAWVTTKGSLSFVVATLDSGVDRTHPDLAGRLLPGRNFVDNGNPYPDDDTADSHGTHVAGLIAATIDNAAGVAGMAGQVQLLPLKVLDRDGAAAYSDIADALRYGADYGAQVINVSLGGVADSSVLADAVYYALGKGALLVAAAGNCAAAGDECDSPNPNFYPAAYPGVLAVGASDHYDRWAPYSGYKPYIALAAPGGVSYDAIWSTVRGGYGYLFGSSMAAPLVSGAAALVWTLSPTLTYSQVTEVLKSTADKVGAFPTSGEKIPYTNGRNDYFGYGRLNVGRAVRWVLPPSLSVSADTLGLLSASSGRAQRRTVALSNPSDQTVWWQANVIQGASWLRVANPTGTTWSGAPSELEIVAGPGSGGSWPGPGSYYGRIRVQPNYPPDTPAVDIVVELKVVAGLRTTLLPVTADDTAIPAWLDPYSPTRLDARVLTLDDDTLSLQALPFPVYFYGGTYTSMYVSDNGYVIFGSRQPGDNRAPSGCLRSADAPNGAVYVNAADWKPGIGGLVLVHRPDADSLVVTWDRVRKSASAAGQSFQLVLRRDGSMRAYYHGVDSAGMGIVGAEYFDGTVADQVYCAGMGRAPQAGDTVLFDTVVPW